MKTILIITSVFAFFVSVLSSVLITKLIALIHENNAFKNYVKTAVTKINQARYGNFQVKFLEENDKYNLYKSLNDLFESIYDRNLVITEYRQNEKENYTLKEEFIAALTHDLKVPIIAQNITFNLLLSGKFGEISNSQKEVIQKLKDSNLELKEMVTSILETYKTENKGVTITKENIEVKNFVYEAIEALKTISSNKNIYFYSDVEEFKANFDPILIKRVLNNLVANAIYHSGEASKVEVCLNKGEQTFSIDVIDYGNGIDESEINKIFNKYYSITGKGKNLSFGLGLYVSNKIVKKHNGKIEVKSKKGEGSVFKIILPLK